jgi:CO/xanthine dehydrogenase FAD-binding subunit
LPTRIKRSGFCFLEVARRRGDFAMMGVAVALSLGMFGQCNQVRVVLCGAGDRPIDVSAAASALIGRSIDPAGIDLVAASVQQTIDPPGNVHASKGYQRHLAGVLIKRALPIALERARHG